VLSNQSTKVNNDRPGHTFALLKTCRQIYSEARLVIYSENTFNLAYYTFYLDTWKGGSMFKQAQVDAVQSIVLDEGRLFFFDGQRWLVPWMAYIETFPNLKKVVLRGFNLTLTLECDAVAEGSASWAEYVVARKNDELEIVVESH